MRTCQLQKAGFDLTLEPKPLKSEAKCHVIMLAPVPHNTNTCKLIVFRQMLQQTYHVGAPPKTVPGKAQNRASCCTGCWVPRLCRATDLSRGGFRV